MSNQAKGVIQQWFCTLIPPVKTPPNPFPSNSSQVKTLSLTYQKIISKQHEGQRPPENGGYFRLWHLSCLRLLSAWFIRKPENLNYNLVFQMAWCEWFHVSLHLAIISFSPIFCFVYWDCISVGKNTQHWAPRTHNTGLQSHAWALAAGLAQNILRLYLQVHFPTLLELVYFFIALVQRCCSEDIWTASFLLWITNVKQ